MRTILLSSGDEAQVDDEDFERLSKYKWHALKSSNNRTTYAQRNVRVPKGEPRRYMLMHREIMGLVPGQRDEQGRELVVDHIDGNGLNLTRANLRVIPRSMNYLNRRRRHQFSCPYIGVTRDHASDHDWEMAFDRGKGKGQPIRMRFRCPILAARVWDVLAWAHGGSMAILNFKYDGTPWDHAGRLQWLMCLDDAERMRCAFERRKSFGSCTHHRNAPTRWYASAMHDGDDMYLGAFGRKKDGLQVIAALRQEILDGMQVGPSRMAPAVKRA